MSDFYIGKPHSQYHTYNEAVMLTIFSAIDDRGEFGVNDKTTQSDTLKLSEDDKVILVAIHDKPTMTQKEYALELGWTVDRVKYYLRKMKIQQIINRVGASKMVIVKF